MISRMVLADGTIRDKADPNTWFAAVAALTNAHIDSTVLAEEGLDIRNVGLQSLTRYRTAERTWAAAWSTQTVLAPAAGYAAEPVVPIVMGTNVELDWTAAILTVAAGQTLVVEADIAFGYGVNAASTNPSAFSTILLLDTGAGYGLLVPSRCRQKVNTILQQYERVSHRCTYAIQPGGGVVNVKKLGLSIGNDNNVYANAAQISAYLVNNSH